MADRRPCAASRTKAGKRSSKGPAGAAKTSRRRRHPCGSRSCGSPRANGWRRPVPAGRTMPWPAQLSDARDEAMFGNLKTKGSIRKTPIRPTPFWRGWLWPWRLSLKQGWRRRGGGLSRSNSTAAGRGRRLPSADPWCGNLRRRESSPNKPFPQPTPVPQTPPQLIEISRPGRCRGNCLGRRRHSKNARCGSTPRVWNNRYLGLAFFKLTRYPRKRKFPSQWKLL